MARNDNPHEWLLPIPQLFLPPGNPIASGVADVRVRRNSDLGLLAAATSSHAMLSQRIASEPSTPGVLVAPLSPRLEGWFGSRQTLSGMVQVCDVYSKGFSIKTRSTVTERLSLGTVELARPSQTVNTRLSIWCINGPTFDDAPTMRPTRRSIERTWMRQLGPSLLKDTIGRSNQYSLDWFGLPTAFGASFAALALVPNAFAMGRLRPIGIHFMYDGGFYASPSLDEIEQYCAIIGFILGRRLIPVGCSVFSERLLVLEQHFSARSINLSGELVRSSIPPIPLRDGDTEGLEDDIATVFNLLTKCWTTFKLYELCNDIWTAESSALPTRLPIYASTFERLARAWFSSSGSATKGQWCSSTDWKAKSARARSVLEGDIDGTPHGERILRRFDNLNNLGWSEQAPQFFAEAEIVTGNVEKRAQQARNQAAHGGSLEQASLQAMVAHAHAYRTLISRAVLHVAGWMGSYVDYSTYGFPSRSIQQPLGGPDGNGIAARAL